MSKLERIVTYKNNHSICEGGVCPAIFKDEKGTFYVQGYIVKSDIKNQIPIGQNEDLISIPKKLLIDLFKGDDFNG